MDKINTDDVANGSPNNAGYGGIFDAYRGFCNGCFAKPLGILHAFEAELMGVITAIEFAIQFNWTQHWFECDAMYVVDLLKFKSKNVPWKFLSRWKRALHYLENINHCVSHVFNEGNQVAVKLASHAIYIEDTT